MGQRGRGQGGHSPASFLQAELSMMTGCCLGILDFRTYLLKSGTGGHSVFNIYCDKSGAAAQGGMLDFRTYLLKSGAWQGGQINRAIPFAVHPHLDAFFLHCEHTGTPLIPSATNPSAPKEEPPRYLPRPKPTPSISTANARRILGVNLNGITEVISPLLLMSNY